eukprot:UN00519
MMIAFAIFSNNYTKIELNCVLIFEELPIRTRKLKFFLLLVSDSSTNHFL